MNIQTLSITESRRFFLLPDHILLVRGEGKLTHTLADFISNIKLRAAWQAIGPFAERATVDILANGDVEYALFDTNNLTEADLADLTTVGEGTRAWVRGDGFRTEMYWTGSAWVPVASIHMGDGEPDDNDGRPDQTVYFQLS